MVQVQDKLTIQQEHVTQILKQLTLDYQTVKPERKLVSAKYPGSDEEFALLEELELLTVNICGYATQIGAAGSLSKNYDQAIAHLQNLRVFDRPIITQFYAEAQLDYPRMQSYIRLLDYLRLLVLEYLQMQQEGQLASA